jgi:hypothetical protein
MEGFTFVNAQEKVCLIYVLHEAETEGWARWVPQLYKPKHDNCLTEPAIGLCSQPHESSSQPPITFCLYFNVILLVVSFHRGFWPELFEWFCILTHACYMSPYVSSAQILPSKYLVRSTYHEIPHCAVFSTLKSLLSWAHSLQHPVFKHSWYLCVIRLPFRCISSLLSSAILRFVAGARHFGTAWWA